MFDVIVTAPKISENSKCAKVGCDYTETITRGCQLKQSYQAELSCVPIAPSRVIKLLEILLCPDSQQRLEVTRGGCDTYAYLLSNPLIRHHIKIYWESKILGEKGFIS